MLEAGVDSTAGIVPSPHRGAPGTTSFLAGSSGESWTPEMVDQLALNRLPLNASFPTSLSATGGCGGSRSRPLSWGGTPIALSCFLR